MKNFSFYWHWLARVAKLSSVQRNAVVKSTDSKSPIRGKTAIFAILATATVLLFPQTTGPSAQSTGIPELPDLPRPDLVPEPALPPFPPGAFDSCAEQYDSRLATIDQSYNSMLKAFQRTRDAKLKIVQDLIDAIWDEIDNHRKKIRALRNRWSEIYLEKGYNDETRETLDQIGEEAGKLFKKITDLKLEILRLEEIKVDIRLWYSMWRNWLLEKANKEEDAAYAEYRNCVDSATESD